MESIYGMDGMEMESDDGLESVMADNLSGPR